MISTIAEITSQYPNIDINLSGGTDSFQEGVTIIERDPIAVVIKHPTDDTYLIAQWKNSAWSGFLTGGIEDGDTLEQTVMKEIHEETGFKNTGTITPMDFVSHGLFFHTIKNVNRLAHYHLVFAELKDLEQDEVSEEEKAAELKDLEQDEVSEEEKAIADFVWVPKDDVLGLLTGNDMRLLWNFYLKK
jgi:8-oxo-dGTP pyrophosphatase MutT (NUDIX family)